MVRYRHTAVAVRGERLALTRLEIGTADVSPGAPQDEMLQVVGLDEDGRIALQVWFDVEDIDAAIAELDAAHARFEGGTPSARRAGQRVRASAPAGWQTLTAGRPGTRSSSCSIAPDVFVESRRKMVRFTMADLPP